MPLASRWFRPLLQLLCLCRLHRPTDLILLLLIGAWASLLASGGELQWWPMLALLLATTLVRCATWILTDWADARLSASASESFIAQGLVSRRAAQRLFAALLLLALLLVLPLGQPLWWLALALPLLLTGMLLIRTRLHLLQPWLGICFAWMVPLAYAAQGVWPDKAGWLGATAVALWATSFTTLYALPRRRYEQGLGIRSLAQLFGGQSWMLMLLMQSGAIFTLWLAGRQQQLGLFFDLGLVVMLLLLLWQLWLLLACTERGALRAYHSQIWSAIALLCGLAFHWLCVC